MKKKRITALVLVIGLIMLNSSTVFADTKDLASFLRYMIERTQTKHDPTEYTGIISAMQNEVDLLLSQADIDHTDTIGGVDFHVGTLCGQDVVIARSGVGKILSSAGITALLNNYRISRVIFTGIAGGVRDETDVLDEVIATRLVQHDYGQISNNGFEWYKGYVGEEGYYPCDKELIDLAYASAVDLLGTEHVIKGTIATGDQFIASEDYVNRLKNDFNAVACEMEGASIAMVCSQYEVPFVVIRAMSDKADGKAHETYNNMADTAADNSCRIVMHMLDSITASELTGRIKIKVLILPKFEIGNMKGDYPGEAQFYYERYMAGAKSYPLHGGDITDRIYVKDGIALCLLGIGKVTSAINTMSLMSDDRFDFSDAYIISTGCAGSSTGSTVMGDVFIVTSAIDYDLGHHADIREMTDKTLPTWFRNNEFDNMAFIRLDKDLTDKTYELVKDIPLKTTEPTRELMRETFNGEEWAIRDPKVLRGTAVTGDNYWKGNYDHENAKLMADTYDCPDPYAVTEMGDIAVGRALKRIGMLDRLIIIRNSVDMDTFMINESPEILWRKDAEASSSESLDIDEDPDLFYVSGWNNFLVGKKIIDSILK